MYANGRGLTGSESFLFGDELFYPPWRAENESGYVLSSTRPRSSGIVLISMGVMLLLIVLVLYHTFAICLMGVWAKNPSMDVADDGRRLPKAHALDLRSHQPVWYFFAGDGFPLGH